MKTRVSQVWETLRSSYWFIPSIMTFLAVVLSFVTIEIDGELQREVGSRFGWLYSGGSDGAREVLSTIAGSMITVAGVVFSITIVALSLASSQFGPRLLRSFMRDTGNQIVLGTFIATFVYCLLVLRTVQGIDGIQFIPYISVTFGLVLALVSLGVLIYFIHHIPSAIQASNVIASVGHELELAIDRIYPESLGYQAPESAEFHDGLPVVMPQEPGVGIHSTSAGYLQAIDNETLLALAHEHDLIIKVEYRPGDFVIAGTALVSVWPGDQLGDELGTRINNVFYLRSQRIPTQDVDLLVDELVEIAVRALSPGINDPFTAITCIDWLSDAFSRLAGRQIPSAFRYDSEGRLRVIAHPLSFEDIFRDAFSQIREAARANTAVTAKLLDSIYVITSFVTTESQRTALLDQATMIERGARGSLGEENDRQFISNRYRAILRVLHEERNTPARERETAGESGSGD